MTSVCPGDVLADGSCLLVQTRCRVILPWRLYSEQNISVKLHCFIKGNDSGTGTAWKLGFSTAAYLKAGQPFQ